MYTEELNTRWKVGAYSNIMRIFENGNFFLQCREQPPGQVGSKAEQTQRHGGWYLLGPVKTNQSEQTERFLERGLKETRTRRQRSDKRLYRGVWWTV